jgi:hypothetical protein
VYVPIRTTEQATERLVVGTSREDHWLEFKRDPYGRTDRDRIECARDVAQFSNASGGVLVFGADEQDHVLAGFAPVSDTGDELQWIDDIVKGRLTPVPPIEPHVLAHGSVGALLIINVPASPVLIARRAADQYEFPVRAGASKRYMTLVEVEARMQNRERLVKLRLEEVRPEQHILLDANVGGTDPAGWTLERLDDHTATLSKGALHLPIPFAYVEAVYRTTEPGNDWVMALSCHVQYLAGQGQHLRVRKFSP